MIFIPFVTNGMFLLMFALLLRTSTSFKFNSVNKILKMEMRVANNYLPHDLKLPVLFEDDHIIALNKPANLRSVPGLHAHLMTHTPGVSRTEEWIDAVHSLKGSSENPDYNRLIQEMCDRRISIPRKFDKFRNCIRSRFKIKDDIFLETVFKDIEAAYNRMHKTEAPDLPLELVSAFDIAEHMCKCKIYVIHRLDMETSGVIVFAKTEQASTELCRQFRDRDTQKVYIAKVAGLVDKNLDKIDAPMCADINNRPVQIVDHVNGKQSLTLVRVIDDPIEYQQNDALLVDLGSSSSTEEFQATDGSHLEPLEHTSLVELQPHTGRTHQLRVHMQYVGHPMLGDTIYAPRNVIVAATRLCLHARSISLIHPVTKERMLIDTLPQSSGGGSGCVQVQKSETDVSIDHELGKRKIEAV